MKESKRVSSVWRTLAIIFGIILLLMTGLLIYGAKLNAVENNCVNYCYEKQYESFTYDSSSGLCSCYVGTKIAEIVPMK